MRARQARRIVSRWTAYLRFRGWQPRCEHCGRRFLPSHSRNSFGGNRALYHDVCIAYVEWRRKAEERLAVLDTVTDVWAIDTETVRTVSANREPDGYQGSNAWDRAWRVFYDLENHRALATPGPVGAE